MSFTAMYPGTCPACPAPIKPGQLARYNDVGEVEHVVCPPTDDELARRNPTCPRCGLLHPGDC